MTNLPTRTLCTRMALCTSTSTSSKKQVLVLVLVFWKIRKNKLVHVAQVRTSTCKTNLYIQTIFGQKYRFLTILALILTDLYPPNAQILLQVHFWVIFWSKFAENQWKMKFLGTQKKIVCHLDIFFDLKLKDLYKHKYRYLWHVLVFHEFYR